MGLILSANLRLKGNY